MPDAALKSQPLCRVQRGGGEFPARRPLEPRVTRLQPVLPPAPVLRTMSPVLGRFHSLS
ncbi:hypothetical protein EMIT048CA2_10603 [Pseudomonas chlororaphis]